MASQIDQILEAYHAPQLEQSFGVQIVLIRAAEPSRPFTATWQDTEEEVVDAEGFLTKVAMRDWLFPLAAAVDAAGQTITPRDGDRLQIVGQIITWEISPAGKLPAVKTTAAGYRWHVKTKRVETDAP